MADGADFHWLTYKQLAAQLGIKLPAAEARARRHIQSGKWLLRRENVGNTKLRVVLVGVPAADLESKPKDTEPGISGAIVGDTVSLTINTLLADLKASQEAVADLRERLGRAEGEATALRQQLNHERQGLLARLWRALSVSGDR